MKKLILIIPFLVLGAALIQAAPLSDNDKQFLARYEKVRSALAADDLPSAKTAASDLGDEGAALAKSNSLKEARIAFDKLSETTGRRAIRLLHRELSDGEEGLGPNQPDNRQSVLRKANVELRRNKEMNRTETGA
jgi:hypothetical protein